MKSHQEKSGLGPGLRSSQDLGFPFNISATDEASNFKFCKQLEYAKVHRKITPTIKKWASPSTRVAP